MSAKNGEVRKEHQEDLREGHFLYKINHNFIEVL